MGLNKSKGNMYPWVTHTWNTVKGKCLHDCMYCYMKKWGEQRAVRFDGKELQTYLGQDNFIFVGSSNDLWADNIPKAWIEATLKHCNLFPRNSYLFHTKNPKRYLEYENLMPPATILGVTIESNRCSNITKAPCPLFRYQEMLKLDHPQMLSIEPVMDFDVEEMLEWIKAIQPEFISIGADSGGHKLPEPSATKLQELILESQQYTEVKIKDNLKRLVGAGI